MGEIVNLDVTTLEESVSVTTTDGGTVEVAVQAEKGDAATISVGTTTTGNAGTNASVTNSGTSSAAVFNFTIPQGATGAAGPNTVTSATTTNFAANTVLISNGTNVASLATSAGGNDTSDSGKIAIYGSSGELQCSTYLIIASPPALGSNTVLHSTADEPRDIDLPNASGTLALTSDIVDSVTSATTSDGTADLSVDVLTANISVNIADNGVDPVVSMTINGFSVGATTLGDGNIYLSKGLGAGSFIQTTNVTSVRTFELPNASGTIALTTSNVATATALETSRNIFGIAFNGTANVSGDATNTGHFASIPVGGAAGHFITLNGTAPTVIAGRSAWWSDSSGNPSFRNGTGAAVTLVRSSDLGTGVATALAVNVGSAGAFVVNGGALGTPSSGTLTSCTGLPISTGVSGLAANVATFLATPSSANLAAAVTDETGTGSLVFANSPTLTTPAISGIATITYSNNTFANGLTVRNTNTGTNALTGITIQNSAGTNVGYMQYCPTNFTNAGLQNTVIFGSIGTQRVGFVANAGGVTGEDIYFKNFSTQTTATMFFQGTTQNIGIGTESPNARAILDITSTTKGFLPPRMTTTQRDAISSPPAGLMIYNTTTNKLNVFTTAWEAITSA